MLVTYNPTHSADREGRSAQETTRLVHVPRSAFRAPRSLSPFSLSHVLTFSRPRRRALSLVESVVSVVIVGLMLVAALNAVGASKATERRSADRARGTLLAQDLLAEILQKAYVEPGGAASLGPDTGEAIGDRTKFDDVDDYHGWSSGPPMSADGTKLPDLTGWKREATVVWVNRANLSQVKVSESGAKLITVKISVHGAKVAELSAVRTATAKFNPE